MLYDLECVLICLKCLVLARLDVCTAVKRCQHFNCSVGW